MPARALRLVRDDEDPGDRAQQIVDAVNRALAADVEVTRHDDFFVQGETVFRAPLPGGIMLQIRCPTAAITSETDWLMREMADAMRSNLTDG